MMVEPKSRDRTAPRVKHEHFAPCLLAKDLEAVKDQVDLTGNGYPKTKRTQGPDLESLQDHVPALRPILARAPRGFPKFVCLRETFSLLNGKLNLNDSKVLSNIGFSNSAANQWNVMLKHAVDLSKSERLTPYDELNQLLEGLRKQNEAPQSLASLAGCTVVNSDSDHEVVELGYRCNCPSCLAEQAVDTSDEEREQFMAMLADGSDATTKEYGGAESDSSILAREASALPGKKCSHKQAVNAARQAKEAKRKAEKEEKNCRRRLTGKTKLEEAKPLKAEGKQRPKAMKAEGKQRPKAMKADEGKQRPDEAMKADEGKQRPEAMKAMKAKKAKVDTAGGERHLSRTTRKTGAKKESYLHVDGEFWVGVGGSQHTCFVEIMDKVQEGVKDGSIKSKAEAIAARDELMDEFTDLSD